MKQVKLERIIEIINLRLKSEKITIKEINKSLADCGMNSLIFIQIIVDIEDEFNCEIPDEKLIISELDSVEKLYSVLRELYEENK